MECPSGEGHRPLGGGGRPARPAGPQGRRRHGARRAGGVRGGGHGRRDRFVGSVKWGWRIDGTTAELLYPTIVEADPGGASREFMEAAAAWNEMEVADLRDASIKHRPMQLPTTAPATAKVLARKLDAQADEILARIRGGTEATQAAEVTATQLREHGASRRQLAAWVSDPGAQAKLVDYATKIQQAGVRYRTGGRLPDRRPARRSPSRPGRWWSTTWRSSTSRCNGRSREAPTPRARGGRATARGLPREKLRVTSGERGAGCGPRPPAGPHRWRAQASLLWV